MLGGDLTDEPGPMTPGGEGSSPRPSNQLPDVKLIPVLPKNLGRYKMADRQFVRRVTLTLELLILHPASRPCGTPFTLFCSVTRSTRTRIRFASSEFTFTLQLWTRWSATLGSARPSRRQPLLLSQQAADRHILQHSRRCGQ